MTPTSTPGLHSAEILTASLGATKTLFVRLRFEASRPPQALIDALAQAGFVSNTIAMPSAATTDAAEVVRDYVLPGTGLFLAWTADQAQRHTAALAAIWSAHGLGAATARQINPANPYS